MNIIMEDVVWSGWYEYNDSRYHMTFQKGNFTVPGHGIINHSDINSYESMELCARVEGFDDAGVFLMLINLSNRVFTAEKRYPSWTIYYRGIVTGNRVSGKWNYVNRPEGSGGNFEITFN